MKSLISALAVLVSLNAFGSELSDYKIMKIPKGAKVVINEPIGFQGGTVGGMLGSNIYIGLKLEQESDRVLDPRTCVIESISGKSAGIFEGFNYTLKLTSENKDDTTCDNIELVARHFLDEATGKQLDNTLKTFGMELILPSETHL